MMIRKLAVSCALAGAFLVAGNGAFAADGATTPQQGRMATCNKEAAGKTGADRKAFMSDCLKAKPADIAPAAVAQPLDPKAAMGACNKAATDRKLAGDGRKTFMAACLKAKGPDAMTK